MNRPLALFSLVAVTALAGCGGTKEATPLQKKEAAHLFSEAQFSAGLRDFAAAEPLLAKATELHPGHGPYWAELGTVRRRLGNNSGAKQAYQKSLDAFKAAAKKDPKDPELVLQQVYVLALLGRADDARATLERALNEIPDDRALKVFAESKQLDRILADPKFKEIAL